MWTPIWRHVSQLEDWHDGEGLQGHNNCAEAAFCRYLRECSYPFAGSDHDLIAWLRQQITGQSEAPGEGWTTRGQIIAFLSAIGIQTSFNAWGGGVPAPWTLLNVRAIRLQPAQYPPSWLNNMDTLDHFILTLPNGLYNDPLAYNNGQDDADYTASSVIAALNDGFICPLPDPAHVGWQGGRVLLRGVPRGNGGTQGTVGPRFQVLVAMELRPAPAQFPAGTELVPRGAIVRSTGEQTPHWARVILQDGHSGWLFLPNLAPVAGG